jgi:hypothetical protein
MELLFALTAVRNYKTIPRLPPIPSREPTNTSCICPVAFVVALVALGENINAQGTNTALQTTIKLYPPTFPRLAMQHASGPTRPDSSAQNIPVFQIAPEGP